ncbi:radical SAM protein [Candidatus Omnitrophota bacterium]
MLSSGVLPKIKNNIDYKEFNFNGKRLLFDVNNCRLFSISPLISDLLRVDKDNNRSRLRKALCKKYGISEVKRAAKGFANFVKHDSDSHKNRTNASRRKIARLDLEITSDCNLNCTYCFRNPKPAVKYMNKKIARAALDYLLENSDSEKVGIYFCGGEPLLNFPLIEYVVRYAQNKSKKYNKSVKFLLNTNGTLLSRKIVNFLDRHFSYIELSLDGDKRIHDGQRPYKLDSRSLSSHKNATKYLPLMLNLFKDRLHIIAVQNPNNPQGLRIYRYFKKLKVMYIKFGLCVFSSSPEFCINKKNISKVLSDQRDLFKEYVKEMRSKNSIYIEDYWTSIWLILFGGSLKLGCGAGRSIIAVSAKGEFFSCHRAVSDPAFKLGSLNKGIDRRKHSFYADRFCDTFIKCRECWVRTICGGGCMWINMHTEGKKEEAMDYYCQLLKLTIAQSIQLTKELFTDKIGYMN